MFLTDGDGKVVTDDGGNPVWLGPAPMNFTSIAPFLEEIRWHLPHLPQAVVSNRVKSVIWDFCRASWAVYRGFTVTTTHLETDGALAVVITTADYMPGLAPLDVGEITVNGRERIAKRRLIMNDTDAALSYYVTDTMIRVAPFSTLPELKLMVPFAPNGEATEYPGELLPYVKGIAAGVLAEFYAMPNVPWLDAGLSAFHRAEYQRAVSLARGDWFQQYGKTGQPRFV